MKHHHVLARSIAATAVAGIALIGFTGMAGASTVTISAPGLLGGNVVSTPVVSIGSGTAAPVPGTRATIPAKVRSNAAVGTVDVPPSLKPITTATGVTGVPQPKRHLVAARASVDACIAAALLTNRDPAACPGRVGGVSALADSLSGLDGTSTLPRALANVGACVRMALAAGDPIDTCTMPVPSPAPPPLTLPETGLPTTGLPTTGLPTDGLPTAALPDGSGLAPVDVPILGADPTTLTDPALATALVHDGLCLVGETLQINGVFDCSTDAGGIPPVGTGSGPGGTVTNPSTLHDTCLGLAAVVGVDVARCSSHDGALHGSVNAGQNTVTARHDGGDLAGSSVPTNVLNGSCASAVSSAAPSSPITPASAAGGMAGAAFVLASLGKRIRRIKRPHAA